MYLLQMRGVFNDAVRMQRWLGVEAALARAQAELGMIPERAAREIAAKSRYEAIDRRQVLRDLRLTRHLLVPTVRELREIAGALLRLARAHRDTPMMGRTLSLQALPITFGFKVAVWLSETDRYLQRLAEMAPRVLVGLIVGAVAQRGYLSAGIGLREAAGKGVERQHQLPRIGKRSYIQTHNGT